MPSGSLSVVYDAQMAKLDLMAGEVETRKNNRVWRWGEIIIIGCGFPAPGLNFLAFGLNF